MVERNQAGLTLKILGLVLTAIFVATSLSNPTVFVINCLLTTIGVIAIAFHQQSFTLLPIAWAALSAGGLAGLNLAVGRFGFDQWTSPEQLKNALVNGQSGLSLLACGGLAAGIQTALASRISEASVSTTVRRLGFITGGSIFLVGCVIAVVASLVNRDNLFDTMTASGLLLIAGCGFLAVSLIVNRRFPELASSANLYWILPNLTGAILLAGLAHTLLWNPTVAGWLNGLTQNLNANWVAMFVLHAVGTGWVAVWMRMAIDREILVNWATLTATVALAGIFILAPHQTGVATGLMAISMLAWWSISWCLANGGAADAEQIKHAGIPFAAASAVLVVIAIAELVSRLEWCPEYTQPRHWLIQTIGLSLWSIGWTITSVVIHRRSVAKRRISGRTARQKFRLAGFGLSAVRSGGVAWAGVGDRGGRDRQLGERLFGGIIQGGNRFVLAGKRTGLGVWCLGRCVGRDAVDDC